MSTLRTVTLNLLRPAGFHSIRAGMDLVMHDITALWILHGNNRNQPLAAILKQP